jgi:hypothetical protein
MMRALTTELADAPQQDRPELMEWAIQRLFGVAHAAGFEAAASLAYRVGDILAGGAR